MKREHLLVRACRGEPVERTPVWAMRQAGRWDPEFRKLRGDLDFFSFSEDVALSTQASLCPRRFGVDGIILFYDITTLAIAMGMEFSLVPNKGPVPHNPIRSESDASRLDANPDTDRYSHITSLLSAVRGELAGELPVLVFASAPFTLASYCVGVGKDVAAMRRFISDQPKAWSILADRITEATVGFLGELISGGAQIYQLFDSWAGELTSDEFESWSVPYMRQVFQSVAEIPSIVFVKDCPHLDQLVSTGASALSLGASHNLSEVKERYPGLVVQGNVDNQILATGTEADVEHATRSCLAAGGGERHVLNLSHGMDRRTPPENFSAFIRTAKG